MMYIHVASKSGRRPGRHLYPPPTKVPDKILPFLHHGKALSVSLVIKNSGKEILKSKFVY